jgi:hypothetical protein
VGNTLSNSLNLLNVTVQTAQVGRAKAQARPSEGDRTNAAYAKDGDPNNGWRTESQAELELALGSATAQRRIEFSLPYAADDIFSGPSGGPFTATASDAPAKANRYGRVQNRLLLGNRSGVNLQLAPERLPAAPFTPLYLQADGLTALYRANGNQWAFDSNGIVCSTDALFWAAVGGTGTFWFPVAPGITTLPAEPAIVDGAMNATNVVLPYNETAVYESRLRLGNVVTKFDYALELLSIVPPIVIKTKVQVSKAIIGETGAFSLTGQTARTAYGRVLIGSAGSFAVADEFVRFKPDRLYPASPAAFSVSDQDATFIRPSGDPNWSSVQLLLHMEFQGISFLFADSGPFNYASTAAGQAQITTVRSKFGSGSGLFDGTSDRVVYADSNSWHFAAGDFTIESWVYIVSNGGVIANNQSAWYLYADNSQVIFEFSANGSNFTTVTRTCSISNATWAHVAACRSGSDLRLFVNGVQAGATYSIGTTSLFNSTGTMNIGNLVGTSSSWNGNLDEVRITKAARYTANFTPPTAAFPDYPQTA